MAAAIEVRTRTTEARRRAGALRAPRPQSRHDVVVVGAGVAGLSAALALKDRGIRPLVLERADNVATAWRARYDRLRLNTPRGSSHLPDRPFPPGTPMFPTRDQLVAHLERHAREPGLEFLFGAEVERIERCAGGWLALVNGGVVRAREMIVATGYDRVPWIPDWPGRERFEGRLVHSAAYRSPESFRDREVLVVGPGSSGMEIAFDLAEGGAAKVWLAARTPPNIFLREGPGGLPGDVIARAMLRLPVRFADAVARFGRRTALGDLTEYGLPVPSEGVFARLRRLGVAPAIVDEEVIAAIKERRIRVVGGVESLDATGARLAGAGRIEVDAVISATGYRRGLEPLVGHLGVLEGRWPTKSARRASGRRRAAIRRLRAAAGNAGLRGKGGQASRQGDRTRALTAHVRSTSGLLQDRRGAAVLFGVRRSSQRRSTPPRRPDEVPAADPPGRRPDAARPEAWERLSEDEQKAVYADYQAINETPGVTPGLQMQEPETATTVRVEDGKTLTTDGPFVAIKEALGGYLVFEADDLDAAIELASRIPAARMGGAIEVRPVVEW